MATDALPPQDAKALAEDLGIEFDTSRTCIALRVAEFEQEESLMWWLTCCLLYS